MSAAGDVLVGYDVRSGDSTTRYVPIGCSAGECTDLPVPHDDTSASAQVSADGKVLFGIDGSTVYRWTEADGAKPIACQEPSAYCRPVAASSDGRQLVLVNDKGSFVWDAKHGTRDLVALMAENGVKIPPCTAQRISNDGLVLVGSASPAQENGNPVGRQIFRIELPASVYE